MWQHVRHGGGEYKVEANNRKLCECGERVDEGPLWRRVREGRRGTPTNDKLETGPAQPVMELQAQKQHQ